jgi:hypothetical protein
VADQQSAGERFNRGKLVAPSWRLDWLSVLARALARATADNSRMTEPG